MCVCVVPGQGSKNWMFDQSPHFHAVWCIQHVFLKLEVEFLSFLKQNTKKKNLYSNVKISSFSVITDYLWVLDY